MSRETNWRVLAGEAANCLKSAENPLEEVPHTQVAVALRKLEMAAAIAAKHNPKYEDLAPHRIRSLARECLRIGKALKDAPAPEGEDTDT